MIAERNETQPQMMLSDWAELFVSFVQRLLDRSYLQGLSQEIDVVELPKVRSCLEQRRWNAAFMVASGIMWRVARQVSYLAARRAEERGDARYDEGNFGSALQKARVMLNRASEQREVALNTQDAYQAAQVFDHAIALAEAAYNFLDTAKPDETFEERMARLKWEERQKMRLNPVRRRVRVKNQVPTQSSNQEVESVVDVLDGGAPYEGRGDRSKSWMKGSRVKQVRQPAKPKNEKNGHKQKGGKAAKNGNGKGR